MHQLDDASFVTRLDPKGMYDLTVAFPGQVQQALDLAWGAALPAWKAVPNNVVLTGLGGSAAGGDFTRALFEYQASVPFLVNRDYFMPNWAGPGTLVFATKRDKLAGIYQTYLRKESSRLIQLGYRVVGPQRVDPYTEFQLKRTKPTGWKN